MTERLVRRDEAAARLDVSVWSVRQLEKAGDLEPVRIGRSVRYRESEIDQFITKAAGSGGQAVKHG